MGQNTVVIRMVAPLQYLLITVKVVALEEVSFSDTFSSTTATTFTVSNKYYKGGAIQNIIKVLPFSSSAAEWQHPDIIN